LVAVEAYDAVFSQSVVETNTLLENLEAQLVALAALDSGISAIREDSVLMELISLNALVIAAKAGTAGRAFSCITAELKLLSNQTMELTDRIASEADSLDQVFSEFKVNLGSLGVAEVEGFRAFLGRIREKFAVLNQAADRVLGGLSAIRARSLEVKAPLVRVIVEMQNQDRIRQSIDHVLLSLREFHPAEDAGDLASQLDELSFLEILPDLSALVLDEVQSQIKTDRDVFQQNLSTAKSLIHTLENEHRSFLAEHLVTQKDGTLEHTFQAVQGLLVTYAAEAGALVRTRAHSFHKSSALQKKTDALGSALRSFAPLTARFRNIDLASRIQVARHAALHLMQANATEMNRLTQKIERDVQESLGITGTFFTTVASLFSSYRDQSQRRALQDDAFLGELGTTVTSMVSAKDWLRKTIDDSRVFTGRFVDQFAQTEADLATLDQLLVLIGAQKSKLGAIKAQVSASKARLMADHGVAQWSLGSEKLKAMVSHFTIFTHKKFAADLGQFELEQSVESGDVTLF
jgi:methyl-accepting chemotaxis protein